MELIGYFALAYLWQCARAVPAGSYLFVQLGGHAWHESEGSGWRLAHPLPSRASLVASTAAQDPEGFSVEGFRSALERARRATRAAARCCDVYLLVVLLGLPVLILLRDPEWVLRRALPSVLLLHGAACVLLHRAQRQFDPARTGPRTAQLVSAALYPPALLRAPHDLLAAELARFHPMTVRAALWEAPRFLERAQQELARMDACAAEPGLDRAALLRLAAAQGLGERELAAPRARTDPAAASYCARCRSDYRAGFTVCTDCGARTRPYTADG